MSRTLLALALVLAAAVLPPAATAADAPQYKVGDRLEPARAGKPADKGAATYRELKWDELISPSWKPEEIVKSLNLGLMSDADPRATAALERLRQEWDRAPGNPALDGTEVRLAGFVVPLERDGSALREFLLVPYFGACVHVPPPPANQIVHVVARKPAANMATMDAAWVSGRLTLVQARTQMGQSGYRLDAALVEPYRKKP